MNKIVRLFNFFLICIVVHNGKAQNREIDFNFDWKFTLVEDTKVPKLLPLNDKGWRDIRLPHDWSVEKNFDEKLEGATGYLPGGVGLYQKHFDSPKKLDKTNTYILFDGVYNNATFWLNGTLLGENPYGYSPTYFNLSKYLKKDGTKNVLTVHVDHSRYADCRWYTGSGIYRNVKLITVSKLHIPIWGTFVTTPHVDKKSATVHIEVKVENNNQQKKHFKLMTKIVDKNGVVVAKIASKEILKPGQTSVFNQSIKVNNPQLWDTKNPNMYNAITTLVHRGEVEDRYDSSFGIRKIYFNKDSGFFLNGIPTLVKGVCLHHAAGLVGAAVPRGVWKRRFKELKACGVNAIRTAHNPYSEEFLELCDEMGFLVQNEFFDEFDYAKDKRTNYHDRHDDYITRGYVEHFKKWNKSDLTRTMLRDRNHPSVFQWSIGNEIEWTYLHYRFVTGFWKDPKKPQASGSYWGQGPMFSREEMKRRYDSIPKQKYSLTRTAAKINAWVKELDTTRPTTANHVVPQTSLVSGYSDVVDIAGFSYRNKDIPWALKNFPEKHITINENPGNWDDWKQVIENPGVFSIFMWTGIDYMGEKHGDWPAKSGWGDLLDLAGFKYRKWDYFKSIWVDKPHISIGTVPIKDSGFKVNGVSGQELPENSAAFNWKNTNKHWNYKEGEMVVVDVCSNYSQVELFLNGRSLGSKSMSSSPDRLFRWTIPYKAGILTAKAGFENQKIVAELKTTSKAVGLSITTDKTELKSDGYDVSHCIVQLIDANGLAVKVEDATIEFELKGNAKILGVDNGAPKNVQPFQSNKIKTSKGRCLLILQSKKDEPGVVKLTAKSKKIGRSSITINIK